MTKTTNLKLALAISEHMKLMLSIDRNEKACHGVTLSQHYVIDALYRKKEMSMKELSLELGLAISTLTRILDILVRDNVVQRKSSTTDRRKVCVSLTEKGLELANALNACTQKFWDHVLHHIPDDKKQQIIQSIQLLNKALKDTDSSCCGKNNQSNTTSGGNDL